MEHFIALDIETGGIGDDKSLLTACFVFCKKTPSGFEILDMLNLNIKPNDDVYRVTAESLCINNIDLKEHNKIAITEREAGQKLYNCLKNWYTQAGSNKLIPIGHNVAFDIRRVTNTLVSMGSWESFVSYRVMDTCTIAQFMRLKGNLPNNLSCSLVNLGDYFKCKPTSGKPHEAEYDVLMTINVLERMFDHV